MDRRSFLGGFAALTAACKLDSTQPVQPDRAGNVVVVILDDMSWDLLQHPQRFTPNLDRLSGQAVTFTNAHCAVAVCGGARGAIALSKYPWQSGIYGNGDSPWAIEGAEPFSDVFMRAGFRHITAGKIHHYVDPRPTAADAWMISKCRPIHPVQRPPADQRPLHGYDGLKVNDDWGPIDVGLEEMNGTKAVRFAREELAATPEGGVLAMVGIFDPHMPVYVPAELYDVVPSPETVLVPSMQPGDMDDTPGAARSMLGRRPIWSAIRGDRTQIAALQRAWLAMIALVDHQIGLLLDGLDLSRDVLVVTSDHGYHLGHKNTVNKLARYRRVTRVPFLVAAPGWPGGLRIDQPVSHVDLAPTLAALAGIPAASCDWEGEDLSRLVFDTGARTAPAITCSHLTADQQRYAVMGQRYTWTASKGATQAVPEEELFDHLNDPENLDNLLHRVPGDARVRAIRDELASWAPDWRTAAPPAGRSGQCVEV